MKTDRIIFYLTFFLLLITIGNCPNVVADENVYLPPPLQSQLSIDGSTLNNGIPIKALIDDPNPPEVIRRIPLPPHFTSDPIFATASFSITYVSNSGADAWGEPCYDFPQSARDVFDAAVAVWANILQSNVPITIRACWADLGSSSTLGYSGGGPLHMNFSGNTRSDTWFSGSLANSLSGLDLSSSTYDMHITYNRNFNWYYGTDGNPAFNQHDLFSVVLHEVAHGLNFSGSMKVSGSVGSWGYGSSYPNIYDVFVRDTLDNQLITSYTSGTTELGDALKSNGLYFHGCNAMVANGNTRVKIYAPSTWQNGSSYSHLDYTTFNNTANQLMVYAISAGESIHDPGVVTVGLLEDLGWQAGGEKLPDLVVHSPNVSNQSVLPGQSISVSAVVRNQGSGPSEASILRYYLSTDSVISSSDSEIGTDLVASMDACDISPESLFLNAPDTLGTYYYGGCVDTVVDETSTSNNCSIGVSVQVTNSPPSNFPWELFIPAITYKKTP